MTREYSMPGYPVLPVMFALASFAVVVSQVVADPLNTAIGLGIVLLGIPVYYGAGLGRRGASG
jgi:APA family basic amino acid/polyamine antiporter